MREIKFRGLSKKTKEMVYGNLLIHPAYALKDGVHSPQPLRTFIEQQEVSWDNSDKCWRHIRIEVPPESVGQYTGLKDKNGAEIYEGDRLQTIADDGTRLSSFEVYWREGAASFAKKRDDGEDFWLDQVACQHLEVIGNVHQPELMEQK